MLDGSWSRWGSDGNFRMFAIFSYDPHRPGNWSIFSDSQASSVKDFYAGHCSGGSVAGGSHDQTAFEAWLQPLLDNGTLIKCEDSCGYAPASKPELCSGVGGGFSFTPFIPLTCEPIDGEDYATECGGPPLEIDGKIYYDSQDPKCIRKNFQGEMRINDLQIPFTKDLVDYFTGILDYENLSARGLDPSQVTAKQFMEESGVFAKLSPFEFQNELKLEFLTEIQERINQGQPTRYKDFLIGGLEPREIKSKFEAIQEKWRRGLKLDLADNQFLTDIWPWVPMFANEESKGRIAFSGDGSWGWVETSIPDVYKLSKVTSEIQTLLMSSNQRTSSQALKPEKFEKTGPVIASPQETKKPLVLNIFSNLTQKIKNVLGIKTSQAASEKEGQPVLLAQARQYSMNLAPDISRIEGNQYSVCWLFKPTAEPPCGAWGDLWQKVSVSHNDALVYLSPGAYSRREIDYHCTYSPFVPVFLTANPGDKITICAWVESLNHGCGEDPRPYLHECKTCTIDPDGNVVGCSTSAPSTDTCPETTDDPEFLCEQEALPGPPQSSACTQLDTQEYPNFGGQWQFKNDMEKGKTDPVTGLPIINRGVREKTIGINVFNTVPYLAKVAENTVNEGGGEQLPGFFRLFIPWLDDEDGLSQPSKEEVKEAFKRLPGEDQVSYSLEITQKDSDLEIDPQSQTGVLRLLFHKLGTIYKVKEYVSKKLLTPY